jgi:outer membrane protein
VANLGADAIWREEGLVLSVGPRLSWGEAKFTRTYFSVDPEEAARSPFGISPYRPTGAALAAGLVANVEYRVSGNWGVTAAASYKRVLGDAADSPIVADLGSPDQFSATLGVRYILGK